ncbi:MAG: tetratricopeptide repeat protein, partial [Gemmatimonadales bacterium]
MRCPQLPPPLAELVMQLLAKNPDDRPQSAADVAAGFDGVFASLEGVSATTGSQQILNSGLAPGVLRRQAMPRLRQATMAAAALVVLALGYAGYELSHTVKGTSSASDRAGGASAFQANSIAVLPFVNTSGDEENKHFSDGLTDELISALGQVQGLKVAARTSVFALSGKGLGARAIADTLGVAKVIDGSARRIGKRLKVTAELVNAADNTVLWSQTFDREMVDVFAVQEEIARSIVGALNVRLTEDEGARLRGRPTKDLEAYDLYLKGRYSWSKRSREGMEAALAYFHSAVERDPSFALAHAGMSDAYVAMSNFNYMPVSEAIANAQIAADRALAIDSSLTEAHASKGFVLASRGAYKESEKELRRAIQLNPSYPSAHHYFTLLLMMLGRLDEATAQNRLTVSLDPFSVPGNATRGVLLCQQRSYAEARRALEKALPLGTGNILAPFYLGVIEAATGRYPESLSHLNTAARIAPGFPGVKAALAFTYSHLGRRAESDAVLARLREAATDDRAKIELAFAEAVMGDVNRAYTILGKSIKWDMPTVIELRTDPLLAAFRADGRY